ncbi:MAG: PKD domain-containing protein [Bacteroidetes bacterium]|nr:PKD domain-containing protein [Bacteroidota bacterium]
MKLKTFLLTALTVTIYVSAISQGQWTWVSGNNNINVSAVYGTQGVPSTANHPHAFYETNDWTDAQGNLWIFGGRVAAGDCYDDVWRYNPYTSEWTWMAGNATANKTPVYGTLGVPNTNNTPGARLCALTWVDNNGDFYMYGGSNNQGKRHADLWKFSKASLAWTWIDGSQLTNVNAFNGTKGQFGNLNTPGSRGETTVSWVDNTNRLWFFGGQMNTASDFYNDVWQYNLTTNQWAWMAGNNVFGPNAAPNWGTQGVPASSNTPGARNAFGRWRDAQGNLWMCGGIKSNGNNDAFNDIWKYDITTNQWTWMYGSAQPNDTGNYSASCYFNNVVKPRARHENKAVVKDSRGNVWMFGGTDAATTINFRDLWIFNMDTLQWKWIENDGTATTTANHGTLGVYNASNFMPARDGAIMFTDTNCNVYVFGGILRAIFGACWSDTWRYTPDTNCVPCKPIQPVVASFYANDTTVCVNSLLTFVSNSSSNVTSYQWYLPGSNIGSSTQQIVSGVQYATSGTYPVTLVVTDGLVIDSTSLTITVTAPPKNFIGNDTIVCNVLSYTIVPGSYQTYLWSNGSTNQVLTVITSGIYWLVVNDGTCTGVDSINVTLQPCAGPTASLIASNYLLCEKGSIDFTDNSAGNPTQWLWYFTGANPSTSTMQNPTGVFYPNYGVFDVSLVVTNSFGSDSLFFPNCITVVANPPAPSITYQNNELCSSPAVGYQWYFNNVPLPNDTTQCFTPDSIGSYYVIITDTNGCNSASPSFVVSGINDFQNAENATTLHPNPGQDLFTITFLQNVNTDVLVTVYDVTGREVLSVSQANHPQVLNVDCSTWSKGLYRVIVNYNNKSDALLFEKL